MAKEICISSTPHETRLAILEDDQLAEIYYERENEYTLAGSIYNGRVTRVLPGMQSAFVDIGLERDAFLYVTDFMELEDTEETDELEKAAASGANLPPREVRHSDGGQRVQRHDQQRERRTADDGEEQVAQVSEPAAETGEAAGEQQGQGTTGARRWRGRRHRRGARGQGQAAEARQEAEPEVESVKAEAAEPEVAHVPSPHRSSRWGEG